jgi:WD40 repeat protein
MTSNFESIGPITGARYWGFISYSSNDATFARWLHRGLEQYIIPRALGGRPSRDGKIPRRLFPIFRDRDELPVSSDLGAKLKGSLERSRYLIAICSPNAAASRWVNEEIRYFKSVHGEDRVFCLIVSGCPNASTAEECFPKAVRFRLDNNGELTTTPTEPIAADVRTGTDGKTNAKLKLIAGLLGVDYDELKQRDQRRRRRRLALFVGLTIIICAAFIGLAGIEEQLKVRGLITAQVERLTQEGKEKLREEKRLQASVYLAKAYKLERELNIKDAVLEDLLLQASRSLALELEELKVESKDDQDRRNHWISFAQFSPDGSTLATTIWDGALRLWTLKDHSSRLISRENSRAASVTFSRQGDRLLVAYWNGLAKIWTLDGALVATLEGHTGRVNYAAFSPDGTKIVTASDDSTARIWNSKGGPILLLVGHKDMVKSAVFSPDSSQVLTASFDGTVKIWDPLSGALISTVQPSADQDELNFAQFSPDGRSLAIAGLQQGTILWNLQEGKAQAIIKNPSVQGNQNPRVNYLTFNHDGSLLLISSDEGGARVWDLKNYQVQMTLELHRKRVLCAVFDPKDNLIASTGDDACARIWDAHLRNLTIPEIASVVETEVPWRLDHGQLVSR